MAVGPPTPRVHQQRGAGVRTQQPRLPGYPGLDLGQLSLLCLGNINIEKLVHVAIRHDLHCHVRHNAEALHDKIIQRFVIVDLSNLYFDVAKDRLYVGGTTSFTRRSCPTVLAAHLLSIVRVIAPRLPHLAEDAWQNLPFHYTIEDGSIAEFVSESRWPTLNETWLAFPTKEIGFWTKVLELRNEVNKVLEVARVEKLIGSSLEAQVYLQTSDTSLASRLCEMCAANNDADTLHRIFITSQAEVLPSLENELISRIPFSGECLIQGQSKVWIGESRAEGSKCERCWNFSPQVGSFLEHPTLCSRCYNVVGIQPIPGVAVTS